MIERIDTDSSYVAEFFSVFIAGFLENIILLFGIIIIFMFENLGLGALYFFLSIVILSIFSIFQKVAFTKDLLKLEKGIFSIVGTGGIKLSGGQRKRIALARALYQNPKILLLDDCMADLDIVTSEEN